MAILEDGTGVVRERYANYLDDPQHLIAVTASANRSKGARGPEDWKPEDRSYWCQYAVDWITIKDDWGLTVTQREHDALVEMLDTCARRPPADGVPPTTSEPDAGAHHRANKTSGNAAAPGENLRQLRRRAGSRRTPCTGQQRRRQGLPKVDGTQRTGRRWGRCSLRKVNGEPVRCSDRWPNGLTKTG